MRSNRPNGFLTAGLEVCHLSLTCEMILKIACRCTSHNGRLKIL